MPVADDSVVVFHNEDGIYIEIDGERMFLAKQHISDISLKEDTVTIFARKIVKIKKTGQQSEELFVRLMKSLYGWEIVF